MADGKITLVFEGMERDQGHVRLETFSNELARLHSLLIKADEAASGGKRNAHFKIVALSHASPAAMTVQAAVNHKRMDTREQALSLIARTIDAVERDEIPPDINYGLLQDLRALASPMGVALTKATISLNGSSHDLTERTTAIIDKHLSEQETCLTTVEGMLEKINIHDEADAFTIYPDVGPKKIACHFRHDLIDKAISGVRRRVAISGLARYRKYDQFPHHIEANDIAIYGVETELASFEDLRGIAPNATGDLSSEDFVRELRNGWI